MPLSRTSLVQQVEKPPGLFFVQLKTKLLKTDAIGQVTHSVGHGGQARLTKLGGSGWRSGLFCIVSPQKSPQRFAKHNRQDHCHESPNPFSKTVDALLVRMQHKDK